MSAKKQKSVVAWYTATGSIASFNGATGKDIATSNTAKMNLDLTIGVTWNTPVAVNLSEASGGATKVIYNSTPTNASNSNKLIKAGLASFTLNASSIQKAGVNIADEDKALLNGLTLNVYVKASDYVRIGTTLSVETAAVAGTDYDGDGKPIAGRYVGAYTEDTEVPVGTVTFTTTGDPGSRVVSLAYTTKEVDHDGNANNYEIYYSISPASEDGLESTESMNEGDSYGTLTVTAHS